MRVMRLDAKPNGFRVLQHKCAKEFDRVKHLERGSADLAPRAFPTLNQADENRSEKKKRE